MYRGPYRFYTHPKAPVHSIFLDGSLEENPDTCVRASPVSYAGDTDDAPILYIAGGLDQVIVPQHGHVNRIPDVVCWFLDVRLKG